MCRNVFVRPAVSPGERISAEGGENKARVRGALTKRGGKTEFRAIECIEHMHAAVDRKSGGKKNIRDITTDRMNLRIVLPSRPLLSTQSQLTCEGFRVAGNVELYDYFIMTDNKLC